MENLRERKAEGQVYPALLLAIFGALALVVAFFGLQQVTDQTGRSDSAGNAAALALGKEQPNHFVLTFPSASPIVALGSMPAYMMATGANTSAARVSATNFAKANGATVERVTYLGWRPATLEWVYRVEVRQNDTVKGGDALVRSTNTSTVAVEAISGMCAQGTGIKVNGTGQCVTGPVWTAECLNSPQPQWWCWGANFATWVDFRPRLVADTY